MYHMFDKTNKKNVDMNDRDDQSLSNNQNKKFAELQSLPCPYPPSVLQQYGDSFDWNSPWDQHPREVSCFTTMYSMPGK